MELKTEYEFILPRGYVDKEGNLHREGVMRLANAKDEIVPLNDLRVQRNRAYLIIVLLSRVISKLGDLGEVAVGAVEKRPQGLWTDRLQGLARDGEHTLCDRNWLELEGPDRSRSHLCDRRRQLLWRRHAEGTHRGVHGEHLGLLGMRGGPGGVVEKRHA